MALSIGGIGAYSSISYVKPMNYTVENDSQVSEAYTKSVGQTQGTGTFQPVDLTSPVVYANAKAYSVDSTAQLEAARKVGQQYNEIAAGFSGTATGYDSGSQSFSYQMVGNNFDMYA
jgi:hypothetical protein